MADTPKPAGKANSRSQPARRARRSISMHEDVPVWYDCCSCEAEPYWAELADTEPGAEPAKAGETPPRRGD
jgi:hypothetical protein